VYHDSPFDRFSKWTSRSAGHPATFAAAVLIIVGWAITGPIFGFSNTWQLAINTGTTIITFLRVFLIQNTQTTDGIAVQLKLAELIRAIEGRGARRVPGSRGAVGGRPGQGQGAF